MPHSLSLGPGRRGRHAGGSDDFEIRMAILANTATLDSMHTQAVGPRTIVLPRSLSASQRSGSCMPCPNLIADERKHGVS